MSLQLSIVVPAYNEEQRIAALLDAYVPFLRERYGAGAELLVVINGTTDGTESVVRRYAGEGSPVRVLVEPARIGKGGAVMLGLAAARGAAVGFVDADGSTPPRALQELVDALGDADAVIASRWLPASRVSPRQPWARRAASRVFNGLVRLLFGLRLTDTQCGAKVLRGEAAAAVLPRLGITRWAFDVDLLFQLRRAGYRIVERPTEWHDVAGSRLNIGRASLEMFVALARLRLVYSPFRWIVRLYDLTLGRFVHRDAVPGAGGPA